jgi:exportin-1
VSALSHPSTPTPTPSQLSSDEATLAGERLFVNTMNLILVGILKHEWPHAWPNFISEIVEASKTSEVLCENNIRILRLLSEEVFDASKGSMTTAKAEALRASMTGEFEKVFQLCEFILKMSTRASLVNETLLTLQRFVTWIPDRYIFETELLKMLCTKFLSLPAFRVNTLQVLTEVGSLDRPAYNARLIGLYEAIMSQLVRVVPPHVSIPETYRKGGAAEQLFIRHLALFMCGFLKSHAALLETPEKLALLMAGMEYLVKISDIDDMEVFKICLDYWQMLAHDLYSQQSQYQTGMGSVGSWQPAAPLITRKALYSELLTRVREVLIKHMAKPEEVLVEADENGDIVREQTKDTEALAVYKIMKDTLVFLTHLEPEDTEKLMLAKLDALTNVADFKYDALNTLCWAIGSISGAMGEAEEKRFIVTVIKDLLSMVEKLKGKNNKAVVASNIMYVVGQYPRFLRAHWKFLRTVVLKLFEFMHEHHPGVQDMAVDTFLKISQMCKKKFVQVQAGESVMFFEEICRMIPTIIEDLETHQVHMFYEACGYMVSAHPDKAEKQALVEALMQLVNNVWRNTIAQAAPDLNMLTNQHVVRELARTLRTNVHVCRAVGAAFDKQLGNIYMDMLSLYQALSQLIGSAINTHGPAVVQSDSVKAMRGCKKEILSLVATFINLPDADTSFIALHFIPPFLQPVLEDYARSHASVRQADVLSVMTEIVNKLKGEVGEDAPRILEAVFQPTLEMITANFEDYPEHRINFFRLLEAINTHCFPALFRIKPEQQGLVVEAIVWAFKHTARDIGETGLSILLKLLQNVAGAGPEVAQPFFSSYFLSLVEVLLSVLTDRLHKAHFKLHATILQQLFALLETGRVQVPLYESAHAVANGAAASFKAKVEAAAAANGGVIPPGVVSNQAFVRDYVRGLLSSSFPALKQ